MLIDMACVCCCPNSLNLIAEDIVKAKTDFEDNMRGLWGKYVKTFQR